MKTTVEKVLDYLWSVDSRGATNAEIRAATGIQSQAQVYMITSELGRTGRIRKQGRGSREGTFFIDESFEGLLQSPGRAPARPPQPRYTPFQFDKLARTMFSRHFGVDLQPGGVSGIPKIFTLVSPTEDIVGDTQCHTLVDGAHPPLAKFSLVSELVWLFQQVSASHKFLVFGNDFDVPKLWLERYGHLRRDVEFFYLKDDGAIHNCQHLLGKAHNSKVYDE